MTVHQRPPRESTTCYTLLVAFPGSVGLVQPVVVLEVHGGLLVISVRAGHE